MKRILVVLGLMVGICSMSLYARQKVSLTRVYIVGFSASFTDSLAYVTGVQSLDSAYVDGKTHFLINRHMYSAQLQRYLTEKKNSANPTCVVFFSTKKKQMDKKLEKLTTRYQKKSDLILKTLDASEFHFANEEYIAPTPEEEAAQEQARKAAKKARKHKKDNN